MTSDAKHVEIGLTDKTDSARAVFAELWRDGIAPQQILIGGDEFGAVGGMPGSDSFMIIADAAGSVVCSVGVEPNGVPDGVVHLGGGPARFQQVLGSQLHRRGDVPDAVVQDGWSFVVDAFDPDAGRSNEALLTTADGMIGSNGAPLFTHPSARPELVAAGVYVGEGPGTDLLDGPRWAALPRPLAVGDQVRRVLDLHAGVLGEDVVGVSRLRSLRFSSLARPGVAVLRADVDLPESPDALVLPPANAETGVVDGFQWMATLGTGGSITAAAWQRHEARRVDRIVAYVSGAGQAEPGRAVHQACERSRRWIRRAVGTTPARVVVPVGALRRRHRG